MAQWGGDGGMRDSGIGADCSLALCNSSPLLSLGQEPRAG